MIRKQEEMIFKQYSRDIEKNRLIKKKTYYLKRTNFFFLSSRI